MKLLTLENEQIVLYEVSCDEAKLDNFLKWVVKEYGFIRPMQAKVKDKDRPYITFESYCDDFDSDYHLVKIIEDRTMIHKGRKRIPRKSPQRKYIYDFTAIDYPEIIHTMNNFFKEEKLDFRVFIKYLYPEIGITFNNTDYYIEEGYKQYDKNALEELKKDLVKESFKKAYIDSVVEKRTKQSECLSSFYETLVIEPMDKVIILMDDLHEANYNFMNMAINASKLIAGGKVERPSNVIKITPSDIELARANTAILNQIGGYFETPNVKQLKATK